MQFSLRRMLLAVAAFAATLGLFVVYAKRFGMFRLDSDPTSWWVAIIVAAFGAASLVLVVHRRDLGRIGIAIAWIIVGLIVGAMFSNHDPPELAIPGGAVVGLIGCILSRWFPRS